MHRPSHSTAPCGKKAPTIASFLRPGMELLEDRIVPSATSIVSNFNGTAIAEGTDIWFNSIAKVSGVGSEPVTVYFNNAHIDFEVSGQEYVLDVPDAAITFDPSATLATTTVDQGAWDTTIPTDVGGNTFLTGVTYHVPDGGLPGGIKDITWSGNFESSAPGIKVQWKWAAAVYENFSPDYNDLNVKPVDSNKASLYLNSDHAGTPEAFKDFVTGGARGGGGSNYTGSYSGTKEVKDVDVVQPPVLASLSGYVYLDDSDDGVKDPGEQGIEGVAITLQGVDDQGHYVELTTYTDANGFYEFTDLRPGTYTLSETQPEEFDDGMDTVGTLGGDTLDDYFQEIVVEAGDQGTDYNFGELDFAFLF